MASGAARSTASGESGVSGGLATVAADFEGATESASVAWRRVGRVPVYTETSGSAFVELGKGFSCNC